jgi:hypothetical protein
MNDLRVLVCAVRFSPWFNMTVRSSFLFYSFVFAGIVSRVESMEVAGNTVCLTHLLRTKV